MFSATWALPLLGAQQLGRTLSREPSAQCPTEPLDELAGEARQHLEGPAAGLLSVFDRLQEGALDIARQAVNFDLLDPGLYPRLAADIVRRGLDGSTVILSGAAPAAARELLNKAEVFVLVREVARLLRIPDEFPLPIEELVARAYDLGDFPALWAVEGLGHDWALSFTDAGRVPRGLLTRPEAHRLPEKSMPMLHAGLGLWAAELELTGATPATPQADLKRRVSEVVRLDRTNARPSDLGAAYESLGLETRLFFPALTEKIDTAVGQVAPEVRDYFWHGAGRAIYFSPLNFLPCSTWQIFETARREAPGERGWLNAAAGLAWALTLVNQRQPWVLDELLIRPHGRELAEDGGFADGVASSVAMRASTTPDVPLVATYLDYQPSGASPEEQRLWDRLVRFPAELGLSRWRQLEAEGQLGQIFRFGAWRRFGRSEAASGRRAQGGSWRG